MVNLGINQAALDKVAQAGMLNAQFEYSEDEGLQVTEEFYRNEANQDNSISGESSRLKKALSEKRRAESDQNGAGLIEGSCACFV